jgi:aquaporin related protein
MIFATLSNGFFNGWDSDVLQLSVALVTGFQAAAVIFCFSSVSGAVFNPAITFALWLTKKLSNRKCIFYIMVQLLASIIAMCLILACYQSSIQDQTQQDLFDFLSVVPSSGVNVGRVWICELITTGILTYVAFTIVFEDAYAQIKADTSFKAYTDSAQGLTVFASTPQSKAGFAPFAIGFTLLGLSFFGGASTAVLNPCRMFGPAIFSGKWDYFYIYYSAQFIGAALAGYLADCVHRYNSDEVKDPQDNTKRFTLPSDVISWIRNQKINVGGKPTNDHVESSREKLLSI